MPNIKQYFVHYPVPTSGGDVGYESLLIFKGGRGRMWGYPSLYGTLLPS